MVAIEDVESYAANNIHTNNAPNAISDTRKGDDGIVGADGDKDEIEKSIPIVDRLPDEEQVPMSPSITKIVVEHGVTENVKIIVEQ